MVDDATGRTLLRAAASGDQRAFAALFDLYAGSLLAAAIELCGDAAVAEEVVEHALVAAWRAAPGFGPDHGSVWSWLFGFVLEGTVLRRTEVTPVPAEEPAATLADVLATAELARRPARAPDTAAEDAALLLLARRMTGSPDGMLDALVEVALDLCHAGTAGVSLLTTDAAGAEVFRWDALAGALAGHVGGTTPRGFSPCGVTLDRGTPQLFDRPGRYFTYFAAVSPPIVEGLVVPFATAAGPLGTIWIVSHDPARRFDWEDARVMSALGRFAATAVELAMGTADARRLAAERTAVDAAARARDDLLGTVVHDLKTPLTSAQGFAQAIRRNLSAPAADPARLDAAAVQIEAAAGRMAGMIDDLADLSLAEAGRGGPLDRRPLDLVALARAILGQHQNTTDRHVLRLSTDEATLVGTWDRARLARMLDNLIGNAVKYSPGGGEVLVELRRADPPEESVVVTVADRGLGVPPADLPKVFDRLHRGANVVDRIPGMGIGLASVRHLVEQHGGTVALAPRAGGGTTATVRLPLDVAAGRTADPVGRPPRRRTRPARAREARPAEVVSHGPRRGRVLVVEDDPVLGDLVHAILSEDGYDVSLLASGEAGALRAAVGRAEPDCILLDGGGAAGYDASWAEAIWAHDRARAVPVVMFTTDAMTAAEAALGESARSRAAGFAAVLAKPFDVDVLLATVERCVGMVKLADSSAAADMERTAALVAKLEAAGAHGVRAGTRGQWVAFDAPDGSHVQLYWRQRDGTYHAVRCADRAQRFELVGRLSDVDTAVALVVTPTA